MKSPEKLITGDLIEILAPAKAIESEHVFFAKTLLEERGFAVKISEHCLGQHHYFSGTEEERLSDLQAAINNSESKAILCARGGYGCVQLVDRLDWRSFVANPKWLIGFSDITVLHQRLFNLGIESVHGSMPLNFKNNSKEALETLIAAISGSTYSIQSAHNKSNISGETTGRIIGGNLSILYSLLGTNDQPDYNNTILFIEEVGEAYYSIDRMFYSLKKSGVLDQINGLIIGGMTSMKDSEIPFGKSVEEIIVSHVESLHIPVCFDFPSGHIDDNRSLITGREARLVVNEETATLSY